MQHRACVVAKFLLVFRAFVNGGLCRRQGICCVIGIFEGARPQCIAQVDQFVDGECAIFHESAGSNTGGFDGSITGHIITGLKL